MAVLPSLPFLGPIGVSTSLAALAVPKRTYGLTASAATSVLKLIVVSLCVDEWDLKLLDV